METYFLKPDNQASSLPPLTYDQRRPLQLLGIFRILISLGFCLLYITGSLITPLGSYNPDAFFSISLLYLALGIAIWLSIRARQILFEFKVWISALTDIVLLTLLMHFSGGIQSGLGVLLVVTLATSSVLLGGRKALGLAAIATLVILIEQFYIGFSYPRGSSYPFAGLLGTTYFASAILFMYVARRVRESEALATRRGIDLANLAQLTQHIIQRMQTGILVLDSRGHIRLLNESAAQMLRIDELHHNSSIQDVAPELAEQWQAWIRNPERTSEAIQMKNNPIDISPRFSRIGDDKDAGAVVFLQDMAAMAQQAQQLQLASLGRLSASIAHEIRNPLGAISHAGQLLAESENLDGNDVRLTQIISDHSRRLNTIVENVMSVSRRNPSQVELFNLKEYVEQFVLDYTVGHGLDSKTIEININPANTMVRFDVGHLHQILNNLFQNALHHSRDFPDNPRVIIAGGRSQGEARPYLDVIDRGPGISDELSEQIFEPFFTTETTGTGLGLYLSRELAEGNQAHLNYIKDNDGKGCFRITFQDPRRQID